MPANIHLTTHIKVRIGDINYAGHLSNDALIGILHDARYQFYKKMGYTELNIEGLGTIMADLIVNYKNESFHGDNLQIDMAVANCTRSSFDLFYNLTIAGTQKVIAIAKTAIVIYDYKVRKIKSIPQGFFDKIDDCNG